MTRRALNFVWNRFEITRPHNLAVSALVVLAGWAAAGGGPPSVVLVWAMTAAALVAAAGNVLNDYFDADIDRINKPRRPIPSGRLQRHECRRYAALLAAASLLAAALSGPPMLLVVLLWHAALYAYSAALKSRVLLGNIAVASVCSSGFVAGAWLAGRPSTAVLPTLLAFLLLMGREIVKDVEDLPGDGACGATTLARRLGARRALGVALGFFLLFTALGPSPYWFRLVGPSYLVMFFGVVLPLLLLATYLMFRDTSPSNLLRVSWILKIDMLAGVLGFYLGHAR
jgi:geranylgeranylglycerol-phosphate geranylgeranyltransferase